MLNKYKTTNHFKRLQTRYRAIVLPGFHGVPFHRVFSLFEEGVKRGSLMSRCAAVSFNFLLAVFPAIIFLFTLIPYIPVKGFQDQLLDILQEVMPDNVHAAVDQIIIDVVRHGRKGLLSIGFLSALYFSTNGVNSMITAFNKSLFVKESRTWIQQRLVSLVLTLILSFLILIAVNLIILSEVAIAKLRKLHLIERSWTVDLLTIGQWAVILALFFFTISFIYYLGPARKSKWRFFSAGSVFATVLSLLASLGFSFFVSNFGKYNQLYGSIGTLIVVMGWINMNSLALIVGFELNASIDHACGQRVYDEVKELMDNED